MHVYCVCPELTKDDDLRPLCCDLVLLIIFVFSLSLSTPSCLLEKLLQVIATLFTLSRFSLIHPTFRFVPIAGMHIVMQQLGCITPPPPSPSPPQASSPGVMGLSVGSCYTPHSYLIPVGHDRFPRSAIYK